jgi:hypothetical protein
MGMEGLTERRIVGGKRTRAQEPRAGSAAAESLANLLRLSLEERGISSGELLWEGFANAEHNGPSSRDGNNGSYDGKYKACSDKRA